MDGALTVHDRVVQRVSETFSDVEFVWMANKDTPDDIFKRARLSVAQLASRTEPLPAHPSCGDPVGAQSATRTLRLPRCLGLRFQGGEASGILAGGVSGGMRISPRNPDDMNPKTVIVMDRATAEWMAACSLAAPWLHSAEWTICRSRESRVVIGRMTAMPIGSVPTGTSSSRSYAWHSIWWLAVNEQHGISRRPLPNSGSRCPNSAMARIPP